MKKEPSERLMRWDPHFSLYHEELGEILDEFDERLAAIEKHIVELDRMTRGKGKIGER